MTNAGRTKVTRTAPRAKPSSMPSLPAGRPATPELNRNEMNGIEQKQSLVNGDPSLSQDRQEWLQGYTEAKTRLQGCTY